MAAFELAVSMGADGVEFDVQPTADGEIVVLHDETLDRTTNGTGYVSSRTLAQVQELDASCGMDGYLGEQVPTLRRVLEVLAATRLDLNIELKDSVIPYPGLAEKVLALVDEAGLRDRVILSTFNHWTLAALRDAHPDVPTGMLFSDVLYEPWNYAGGLGVAAVHPHHRYLRFVPSLVDECHASGLAVNTWTVNDPVDLRFAAGLGVDAVITNHPDLAREVLDGN